MTVALRARSALRALSPWPSGRLAMLLIRAQQSNPMPSHVLPCPPIQSNPGQSSPIQACGPPPSTIVVVVCCLLSSPPLWTRTLSLLVRVTARGPRASPSYSSLGKCAPPRLFSLPPFLHLRLRLRLLLEAFHKSAFLDVSPATTRCRVPPCSCVQPSPHSLLITHYALLITPSVLAALLRSAVRFPESC
jgi:hypothetical protein